MRVLVLPMLLSLLSCVDGDASTPAPPPTLEAWCRCSPYERHLALVRVDSEPVSFTETRDPPTVSGVEFSVALEGELRSAGSAVTFPPIRFRARQYLTNQTGAPIFAGTTVDDPRYVRAHMGDRLFVELLSQDPWDSTRWAILPRAANVTTGALTRPLFSFPVGTPASQVLDPAEWTCNTATPTRGDCTPFDAGSL